jgi:hypothetical protein
VANPPRGTSVSAQAQSKLAWVPNLFCGSYRKGSSLDFMPAKTSPPPFSQNGTAS